MQLHVPLECPPLTVLTLNHAATLKVGIVHADIKPRNIIRIDRDLRLFDLDSAIRAETNGAHDAQPITLSKLGGSTAYAAPELIRWLATPERKPNRFHALPLNMFKTPQQIDLWSFGVSLYEMAVGSPLLQHSYDQATHSAEQRLMTWDGLQKDDITHIEALHGRKESMALVDLLQWCLAAEASTRPDSTAALLSHAFFDPTNGTMQEHFVADRLRELLVEPGDRPLCKVMLSYCWADTHFVLNKLALELAPKVQGLWLDRLGGNQGMGEWTRASMEQGVAGADVIIAVVSSAYIKSKNCGFEMELASRLGKTIVPITLDVPYKEWPPAMVGETLMTDQFASANGDLKLYINFSDREQFFTRFKQELSPRLYVGGSGGGGSSGSGSGLSSTGAATDVPTALSPVVGNDGGVSNFAAGSVHVPVLHNDADNDAVQNQAAVSSFDEEMAALIRADNGGSTSPNQLGHDGKSVQEGAAGVWHAAASPSSRSKAGPCFIFVAAVSNGSLSLSPPPPPSLPPLPLGPAHGSHCRSIESVGSVCRFGAFCS
jgi:hypothetical protein